MRGRGWACRPKGRVNVIGCEVGKGRNGGKVSVCCVYVFFRFFVVVVVVMFF